MKFYLNTRQTIFALLVYMVLGVVWMAGFHGYGVFDTAMAVCGLVAGGLFLDNLKEGLKRAGKKLYYIENKLALKMVFTGLFLTLSLLYVCEIPYDRDFLTYGSIVGVFATLYKEYQVRQDRGLKVHFDVIILNDGTYSIGSNNMVLEIQDEIRELSEQRLRDPQEITYKIFAILGKYESRSPEEMMKRENIVVTLDLIIRG